jgi:3-oxoacyl-[acyl-carrier protein] reductase
MTVEEALQTFPAEAGITRYGQPEDIANVMAFMVSPAGKWMTGSAVRMDGGEIKGIQHRFHAIINLASDAR